ncbi:MAG: PEP-CTERM sorting domain-containing protein [Fimbriimonadaceae bacterium]
MNLSFKYYFALSATALIVCDGNTQTITSRFSHLNYNAVYGGGGDAFTPSDSIEDTGLVAADSEALAFADSKAGFILGDPNRPWNASVETDLSHSYAITGSLSNFSRIVSSGRSMVAAAAGGEGLALMNSGNPGNVLQFEFTLTSSTTARLRGAFNLNPDGQNLAGEVALQRFDGIVWQYQFTTLFLPGQEGAFDETFNLSAGMYRLTGGASGNAFHGVRPIQDNDWNYDFQAVPEPATMAALGLGIAALLRRRRA